MNLPHKVLTAKSKTQSNQKSRCQHINKVKPQRHRINKAQKLVLKAIIT